MALEKTRPGEAFTANEFLEAFADSLGEHTRLYFAINPEYDLERANLATNAEIALDIVAAIASQASGKEIIVGSQVVPTGNMAIDFKQIMQASAPHTTDICQYTHILACMVCRIYILSQLERFIREALNVEGETNEHFIVDILPFLEKPGMYIQSVFGENNWQSLTTYFESARNRADELSDTLGLSEGDRRKFVTEFRHSLFQLEHVVDEVRQGTIVFHQVLLHFAQRVNGKITNSADFIPQKS